MKRLYVFLTLVLIVGALTPVAAQEGVAEAVTLIAPDGATVEVERDDYGVPHITADTEVGVFFGQGFAVAQDRLFQLEQYRRAALGTTAELLPTPQLLEADMRVRTQYYTEDERQAQFNALPANLRTMMQAYVDGINVYLDSLAANPGKYRPLEFVLLLPPEPWTVTHSVAVTQFFMRQFGQFGGQELERLAEFEANGETWFEQNRPINDPSVPTTIPGTGTATPRQLDGYTPPPVSPEVVRAFTERRRRVEEAYEQLRIPKLGSFAVLTTPAKSATGNVQLLGAPQMGRPTEDAVSVVNEVELISPTLHIAGMSVAGIPGVAIGRNEYFAWTLTSGVSDNTDTFRETVQVQDGAPTAYLFNGEFLPFETREETVFLGTPPSNPNTITVRRTVHGPVVEMDLDNEQVFSHQMTFWNAELDLAEALYDIWKATDLAGFEAGLAKATMNFNVLYADREQNVKFFHVGRLLRSHQTLDGPDPRFPRNGDGTEEWGDDPFLAFEELPQAANPAQGYFVNWNNKPVASWNHGDIMPWADVVDTPPDSPALRVAAIDAFVGPIQRFTFDNLRDVYGVVRDVGSYPGTYQQILEFMPQEIVGENLVPPGQSGFTSEVGVSSVNLDDQWPLYQSVTLKPFLFSTEMPTAVEAEEAVPEAFVLYQNYPNPFNPKTTIVFDLPRAGDYSLTVYDVLGREVAVLASGTAPAGRYRAVWDATGFASGVYLYRLQAGTQAAVQTLILQK